MNTTKNKQPVKIRFRTKKHFQRLTTSVNFNFLNSTQVQTEVQTVTRTEQDVSVINPELVELTEEQKKVLMHWIDENLQMINTINKKNTVFELINAFNMTINSDFQVTADQFCSAMLESGFRYENGRFNVSGVSIKKLRHIVEKLQKIGDTHTRYRNH